MHQKLFMTRVNNLSSKYFASNSVVTIQVQVKSQKDLEWLYSAVAPTTHTNFSQQPDTEKKNQFQNSILDFDKVESNSSL